MDSVEALLAARIRGRIEEVLGARWDGPVPVELSNRPELGDYASAVAFPLAKEARRAPLGIAEELASGLGGPDDPLIAEAVATAPAFLNLRLSPRYFEGFLDAVHAREGAVADREPTADGKVVIEHTNINPNKAAHVGHFRNACLGDTVARMLRRLGHTVEVQNYIDDTGVQVADVVVGLRFLDPPPQGDAPFDRYCSEVYVAVQRAYEADPELLARRAEVQAALEEGEGALADFAGSVARRVAACNLATMARAGISYDLLTWESDILRLGFWSAAFERLRARNAIRLEDEGPNAGCWVVPFGAGTVDTDEGAVTEDKVLVTSKETITYTAKDIAYQLWKFGLLGLDFGYARWEGPPQPDGRPLWTGTSRPAETDPAAPDFADGERVINVIDDRQAYPQQVVYESLRRLGYEDQADRSEHLGYAVVNLSVDAARELGVDVEEGASQVAMSGRGGIQVYADDLLDRLEERLAARMEDPDSARAVAIGAARYYMLKFGTTQQIAFDFEEALRTSGETGVYLQYAYVRACGILRRLEEAGRSAAPGPMPAELPDPDRALLLRMIAYPRVLALAGAERSPQTLAKHAFELATTFSAFYDNTTPIVKESDEALAGFRAGLVAGLRLLLADILDVLGIPAPERI